MICICIISISVIVVFIITIIRIIIILSAAGSQKDAGLTTKKKHDWLVVSTHLKTISQLGLLFPIYGKYYYHNCHYLYMI